MRVVWRYSTTILGAPSVMTPSGSVMHKLSVDSLGLRQQLGPSQGLVEREGEGREEEGEI